MSYRRRYRLKDERFGLLALTLRERTGLTQAEVANELRVSERTIRYWEAGTAYPSVSNLKDLIEIYWQNGAFVYGREREDIKAFWAQATESASHRQSLFDEGWFESLFRQPPRAQERLNQQERQPGISRPPSLLHRADWGGAIDVASFYGRERDLLTLKQWVEHERCRVVILLGMGGIGKTTLAIRFAQEMIPRFGFVLWRSLRNVPPLEELLADCIQALSEQQAPPFLHSIEKTMTLLIELLRNRRCLLVLDNVEALLQPGSLGGSYLRGYEGYGQFIQRVGTMAHQSCLLLTSREMLNELEPLEGTRATVRGLKLSGLGELASQELLADKDLFGSSQDWQQLIQNYSGNPLALKIVGATVRDLFGGDIASFVREGPVMLHTLQQLLEHQFLRLAPLERDIMYWLAIERDLISLETLRADLPAALSSKEVFSALQSLLRRCLVERGEKGAIFTLQPEVMEYVTERLVEQMCEEIIHESPKLFLTHALMKAQSHDYLRESQGRMLVQPVLRRLLMHLGGEQEVEEQLCRLVHLLQERPVTTHGYSGGNLVNLFVHLKGHLKRLDLSLLAIRQAYLQGIEAQDANLAGAWITEAVFMEPIESIAAMALSPDGRYLAVGSFSGQIRVWRVADRKALLAWQGHSRIVWALAFSRDSTTLASGSYDGCVKLWEMQGEHEPGGRCLRTFSGHERWIRSIAFSPDGTLLATAGDDKTIRLWDAREGTCLRIFSGNGMIWSVAFSPDNMLLVSGELDETVRLWEVREGRCLHVLHGHTGMVMAVAFHPSGDFFVSGDESGRLNLWDAKNGSCLATSRLRTMRAASISFNTEGRLLAIGSLSGAVEVWHVVNKSQISRLRTLPGHPLWVSTVAFGPDNFLASISYGGGVKLWDGESGRGLGTLQGYSHVIGAISFSPDGNLLVHGDDQGILRVWDVQSGRCCETFQGHTGRIWSVVFSPDGKTIASGGDDQVVRQWRVEDVQKEASEHSMRSLYGHTTIAWSVAFSPDGNMLASSGFERTVKLWKIGREKEEAVLTILRGHPTFVWSVAFSPDGSRLASGDDEGVIKVWNVESGECLITLQNGHRPMGALAFSSDGNTLLSCSNEETLTAWDMSREEKIGQILQGQGQISWTKAFAFNSDGTKLAVGSDDHTVRVWEREETGGTYRLRTFSYHGGQVWSVAFSPDGRILASGDDDGTLVLWNVETGACRQILRSDRPYERMNIQGVKGLTQAQRGSLRALGAVE